MTLKEAVGMETIKNGTFNIGFEKDDETQFDVDDFNDLQDLWEMFCEDNGIPYDCVDYVEEVIYE